MVKLSESEVINFFKNFLNEDMIKKDYNKVRDTASRLAEMSLKTGCDDKVAEYDVTGIKLRYINTWLQKTDGDKVIEGLEKIRGVTNIYKIHEWGKQV